MISSHPFLEFAKAHPGIVLVLIGVFGEGFEILAKIFFKKWARKHELRLEIVGAFCWILVVVGLAFEIPDAAKTDKEAADARLETAKLELQIEQAKPENRPIVSISATARILVKGDRYMHSPITDDNWRSGIGFCIGTNISQMIFSLSATKSDVEMANILGKNTDREYFITFHKNPSSSVLPDDAGWGKPANIFNAVESFVLEMPQIETNTEVLSGSVVVTANDLNWVFDVPQQKQKYGMITSMKVKNALGKIEVKVMPTPVADISGNPVGFFDGK